MYLYFPDGSGISVEYMYNVLLCCNKTSHLSMWGQSHFLSLGYIHFILMLPWATLIHISKEIMMIFACLW